MDILNNMITFKGTSTENHFGRQLNKTLTFQNYGLGV